jgi:hypothetical protein
VFEKAVLERFVKVAGELLAVPVPKDRMTDLPARQVSEEGLSLGGWVGFVPWQMRA